MALWFQLMVNRTEIGAVEIVRRDEPLTEAGEYTYDWCVVDSSSVTRRRPRSGELQHRYDDGALVLVAKVLEAFGASPSHPHDRNRQ